MHLDSVHPPERCGDRISLGDRRRLAVERGAELVGVVEAGTEKDDPVPERFGEERSRDGSDAARVGLERVGAPLLELRDRRRPNEA